MISLKKELLHIKKSHLYRSLKELQGLDFISNDYLDFSYHSGIRKAIIKALRDGVPSVIQIIPFAGRLQ